MAKQFNAVRQFNDIVYKQLGNPMQKPMLDQENSSFFKLPAKLRQHIYATDKSVIAKLEQTCQRIHSEVDVLVDAKSMDKDMSSWSQIRKFAYGSVKLLPLKTPKTAKTLCRNAFALYEAKREVLDLLEAITKSSGDSDKQQLLMSDLRNRQQHHRALLDAEVTGLDPRPFVRQQD